MLRTSPLPALLLVARAAATPAAARSAPVVPAALRPTAKSRLRPPATRRDDHRSRSHFSRARYIPGR